MVIVDSNVWSEAFRKNGDVTESVLQLRSLIEQGVVVMIGPIRQEVLSGIKESKRFEMIKKALRAFPSQKIDEQIFEVAASFFNLCRSKGIQGSHTDFLIAACAVEWDVKILTKDKDFDQYSEWLPLELY